jgi:hypothetical protein
LADRIVGAINGQGHIDLTLGLYKYLAVLRELALGLGRFYITHLFRASNDLGIFRSII